MRKSCAEKDLILRKIYFSQFRPSDKEIEGIWKSATLVFDANTILNLYRYSDKTRSEFIEVLKELKDRLWIPEQVAQEFFANRLSEISVQVKAYDTTKATINSLHNELTKSRGHPHISQSAMDSLSNALKLVEEELANNQKIHLDRVNGDDILENLASLFEGKIGDKYENAALDALIAAGEERMKARIPPGYMDYPKHKDPNTEYKRRSNYGDLIVWMQTIDFCKSKKKPVILVTDDSKEDWWLIAHGRTIGVRPELREEFYKETGQQVILYSSEQFLRYAKDHLRSNVSNATIDEVKESGVRIIYQRGGKKISQMSIDEKTSQLRDAYLKEKFLKLNKRGLEANRKNFIIEKYSAMISDLINIENYYEALEVSRVKINAIRKERQECEEEISEIEYAISMSEEGDSYNGKLQDLYASLNYLNNAELDSVNTLNLIKEKISSQGL